MNKNAVLETLSDFIAIQSVSTDPNRREEIVKAADFLKRKLEKLGFQVKLIKKDFFPPLLVAYKLQDPKAKTLGIYGHYDVQPEDPTSEWKTPPFKLSSKNGKLYGRGVADNKGHIIQNLTALTILASSGSLNNNIMFVIEGEEETGSIHFKDYVDEAKSIFSKVDIFYVTDSGMHKKNVPQIEYGLRGILYYELSLKIGKRDLHSGVYGNRVYNPIQIVADLLSKMKKVETGRILVPHFYDKVRKISQKERRLLDSIRRSDEDEKKEAQTYAVISQDLENPSLSSKVYPSFEVNGIVGGYTGEGAKTIVPNKATVKFSFRLVEHQNPYEIEKKVESFIGKHIPNGVKWSLKKFERVEPFYTDIDSQAVKKTALILEREFGHKTLFNRSGGSIPAAGVLKSLFNKPIVLTGFTLPDDNIHAPNENFDEEMFWKGIEALKTIYSQ